PATITTTPLRTWSEPDCERLGEVFRRMCLRIPRGQVQHILAALRFGFVEIRIRLRKRAEELAMLAFEVQPEGCVESVTGFVSQNSHALRVSATFDFQHLLSFELYQPRVREVK